MIKLILKKIGVSSLVPIAGLFGRKSDLDSAKARNILNSVSPQPTGTGITKNRLQTPYEYDLQIVIPAYNVEKYLRECIDSVLSQKTKYRYKIVLVDDGATDSTPAICDEYANDDRVEVIHQKNSGLSGARNRALKQIFASYVMFLDSDDMLCENAIESIMNCAVENDAQIVEGGMYDFCENSITVNYEHKSTRKIEYALGLLAGFACGKVFKAALFENRSFPEGYWFEDTVLSFLMYPLVNNAYFIKDFVYKYRNNPNSITNLSTHNPRCCETYWITETLLQEHEKLGLPRDVLYLRKFFRQVLLNAKRTSAMSKEVQESIFVLSCELMDKYIDSSKVTPYWKALYKCMKNRKFEAYRLFCRLK